MKVSVPALLMLVVLVHEVVCRRNGSGSNGSKSSGSNSDGSKSSGRGSNGSKSNGNKSSGNKSNGSGSTGKKSNDKSTEVTGKVSTDGKNVKVEGSVKHDTGNGVKVDVGGHADTQGNVGVSTEVKVTFKRRRRRSFEQERYFTQCTHQ
ncbi:uncharacterized protein LOC127875273 [Dreissena polymorpha]|uniref:Uncharacterized protein n=1 Tax=Dreissena polymorpha TaxID=45954 RepID=A0A9D4LE26_DREPO|nr:uncharacterized protein LOC127875273 [Dreissena polymorpha]KAH3856808.1 hypothetical protein DPMN_099403 [Dreissena polymorpha]